MKLTDSHLALLARASQRDDGALEPPAELTAEAANKIATPLLKAKLVEEVRARPSHPVWRRDEQEGPSALIITDAGLKVIRADVTKSAAGQGRQKPRQAGQPQATKQKKSKSKPAKAASQSGGSKQDRIVALLRRPQGATIAAVMKATGWQQHSVRGFLAGTVRKKLKLNLISEETKTGRVYRIKSGRR